MTTEFDFSGYATKAGLECSDGRTILPNAFKDNDGEVVPLVWNHQHSGISNVLGHALLENREDGVYAFCSLNNTAAGKDAKEAIRHHDLDSLSIYANNLVQKGPSVIHGVIREVSLVLAGANPGATIENLYFAHSDEIVEDEAIIRMNLPIEVNYNDEPAEDIKHSEEATDDKEKDMAEETKNEKTVKDVFDTLTDEQKQAVYVIVGQAVEEAKGGAAKEDDSEGGEDMKHNVFEGDQERDDVLIHDGLNEIMKDAKRCGSLKESFLQHAAEYGIENIEYLQPDAQSVTDRPAWININPTGWVTKVINGVHHTPFAKVKMIFADITADEARAKGYTKGNRKEEEVFTLLKREVGPTTIYKKQKFDRDDLIDAEFDVVPWVKAEMEQKLDEEKARAYIFGDGRSAASPDKVKENCIIPVVSDDNLYSLKVTVTPAQGESLEHALITAAVIAQDDYEGSGNTTAFIEAKQVSRMLLMEDQFGHRLYKDVKELAAALGVGEVVKVPAAVVPEGVYGVILDLNDYNVGQKAAGKKNLFDDFDIDYNQLIYLIEERESGALIKPKSAIVLKEAQG